MKSLLALIFAFFTINTLLAQKEVQFSNDSDTAFWYRHKNAYARQFNLGLIESDTTDYSFRFWSFGLVIKVASKADKNFGEIIRFVEAYPNDKTKKVFTNRYTISPSKALQVRHLVDSLKIEVLASDKHIRGWQHGFDGIEYFTEYKKNGLYSFKNYWTPTSQDTLKEAIQLQNFVSALDTILDLPGNSKIFQADIPFDSWSYPGSGTVVLRVKSKSKKKNGG